MLTAAGPLRSVWRAMSPKLSASVCFLLRTEKNGHIEITPPCSEALRGLT